MRDEFHDLEKFRICTLFQQNISVQISSLFSATVYLLLSRGTVPATQLMFWFVFYVVFLAFRFAFLRHFSIKFMKNKENFDPQRWENYFTLNVLVAALLWGVAGSWMVPAEAIRYRGFISMLLAGVASGGAIGYCLSSRATTTFTVVSLLPYAISSLSERSTYGYTTALLVFSYMILLKVISKQVNRYAMNSLEMIHEKTLFLIEKDKLLKEKDHLFENLKLAQVNSAQSTPPLCAFQKSPVP